MSEWRLGEDAPLKMQRNPKEENPNTDVTCLEEIQRWLPVYHCAARHGDGEEQLIMNLASRTSVSDVSMLISPGCSPDSVSLQSTRVSVSPWQL
jgi:hypothetical protein